MYQPPVEPPPGSASSSVPAAEHDNVWADADTDTEEWLADLTPAELEALYTNPPDVYAGKDEEPSGSGFAAGGWLDQLIPGPVLSSFSQDTMEAGLGTLDDDELVGLLRAARRLASWQAAVELRAVGELDARRKRESGRPGWSRISEHISCELAAALSLTGRSADMLLCLSRDLTRLPMVLRALAEGRIDRTRAEIFATELAALGDVAAATIADALCDVAGSMTTSQLRYALRRMVLAIDPDAARRRAAKARADARVETWSEGSGNAGLAGRELPSGDAIAADHRIAAIARALKAAGASGTMDQLRATVFLALLTGRDPQSMPAASDVSERQPEPAADTHTDQAAASEADLAAEVRPDPAAEGGGSVRGGEPLGGGDSLGLGRPWWAGPGLGGSVNLTMPLTAWLGESDAPGDVAGLGPLDADTCRELAERVRSGPGSRWCVTLTGRDGRAVAHACGGAGLGPPPSTGPRGPDPPRSGRAWLARLVFTRIECGVCGHEHKVTGYRPDRVLRNIVKVRHRTCAFPGCRRPAAACDDDHTIPYDQGGMTCACNLAPACES